MTLQKGKNNKSRIKAETKKASLTVPLMDIRGQAVGKMTLPSEIFGAAVNVPLMTQAIHVYRQNQRHGTAKAKTRGEVTGTTKKMYRQKHTGRARHGAQTAPLFVGGGVAHGPLPKDWSRALPKKMRRQALFSALTDKQQHEGVVVITGLEAIDAKTRVMVQVLDALKLRDIKKRVLLVTAEKTQNIERSAHNLPDVTCCLAANLYTHAVISCDTLLITQDAVGKMTKVFIKSVTEN